MKTYHNCIPCFVRQTLEAVRHATADETIHEQVLRNVLQAVSIMDLEKTPPLMGQYIHRLVRELSGSRDPYKSVKEQSNQIALNLYPSLRKLVIQSPNRIETAVRIAIAGNIIDFGIYTDIDESVISAAIEKALSEPLAGNIGAFCNALETARNILYIGDNAGEIVFDRLLVEQLQFDHITYTVRGNPVINDATMEDAEATGMASVVRVLENGTDAPGTILEECSQEFVDAFNTADLIVAKGQGNFETLSGVDRNIFFLLKAKCPVVAEHIGCKPGEFIAGRMADFPCGVVKRLGSGLHA